MTTQHTDQMRDSEVFPLSGNGTSLDFVEGYRKGKSDATASAEARYLPVIEKLVGHLENIAMRIQNELPLPGPSSGIHQSILATLAEAAPLLKG